MSVRGTIRYWAAAKAAAGVAEESYDAATLGEVLAAARRRHAGNPAFAAVLDRCSFVVDGHPIGRRSPETVSLVDGGCIEALPPFAGGAPAFPRPRG
ncbi:MoaD/ThiS family protein [soil metagenome]